MNLFTTTFHKTVIKALHFPIVLILLGFAKYRAAYGLIEIKNNLKRNLIERIKTLIFSEAVLAIELM